MRKNNDLRVGRGEDSTKCNDNFPVCNLLTVRLIKFSSIRHELTPVLNCYLGVTFVMNVKVMREC